MARILIIDDEDAFRSMLARRLERETHEILEARDGREGLRVAEDGAPDLVITDLIMPEKEGIETIMALKHAVPGVPIIAVSGGGRGKPSYFLSVAKRLGARYAFEKPLDWEVFIQAVRNLVD